MLSDVTIALAAAIGGVVVGFVVSRVSDWFENRAEADTPEDDKWELYTLLTYCNMGGPIKPADNQKDSTHLRLSAKSLNELSITSMNSTRDHNNYRPTFTMRHFRINIIPNLSKDKLIKRAAHDGGTVHKLLQPVSKIGFLQNRVRYTLSDRGARMMQPFVEEFGSFLYDKQRDNKQHVLNVVHVNPLRTDAVRKIRWGEIIAAFENLADFGEKDKKTERQRLELERDGFMAEVWTCEDWLTKTYRERLEEVLELVAERERLNEYRRAERIMRLDERSKRTQESEKRSDTPIPTDSTDKTWYVVKGWPSGVPVEARGYFVDSHEFCVVTDEKAGKISYASKAESPSLSAGHHSLREKLRKLDPETGEEPVLVADGERYRFARSYNFTTSSQAASVVLGRVSSGRSVWKREESV